MHPGGKYIATGLGMFSETTLLNYESYLYVAVILIVGLILLIVNEYRLMEKGNERAKMAMYALLTAFIVVTASTAVFIIAVEVQGDRYEYVYSATVESLRGDRVGVVLIPVCGNEDLQDRIRVTSGDGEISIVETEHGRALRLEFRGDVTVEGRISLDHPVDDWEPTMFNNDSRRSAWISMEPAGTWKGIVVLDLDLGSHPLPGHDEIYQIDATLVEGWDLYKVTSGSE